MFSRSAADSGRATSVKSEFIGSTVCSPSSEERISRAGPASATARKCFCNVLSLRALLVGSAPKA
jgi:hypothetical protein